MLCQDAEPFATSISGAGRCCPCPLRPATTALLLAGAHPCQKAPPGPAATCYGVRHRLYPAAGYPGGPTYPLPGSRCCCRRALGCRLWHWLARGWWFCRGCQATLRFRAGQRSLFYHGAETKSTVDDRRVHHACGRVCASSLGWHRAQPGPYHRRNEPWHRTLTSPGVGREPRPPGDGTWGLTPALTLGTSIKLGCPIPVPLGMPTGITPASLSSQHPLPTRLSFSLLLWCGHTSITPAPGLALPLAPMK